MGELKHLESCLIPKCFKYSLVFWMNSVYKAFLGYRCLCGERSQPAPGVREARAVTLPPPLPGVTSSLSLRIWLPSLLGLEGNGDSRGLPECTDSAPAEIFLQHQIMNSSAFLPFPYIFTYYRCVVFMHICIYAYSHVCICVWTSEIDICWDPQWHVRMQMLW